MPVAWRPADPCDGVRDANPASGETTCASPTRSLSSQLRTCVRLACGTL